MDDYKTKKYFGNKNVIVKNKNNCPNVFSNFKNIEKNK